MANDLFVGASFISTLSYDTLQRLRRIVKERHMAAYPLHMRTDREADRIIEANGDRVMQRALKRDVDAKLEAARSYA